MSGTTTTQPAAPPSRPAPGALPRLLAAPPAPRLVDHVNRFGPPPKVGEALVAAVERSGLRGHGGAGFPTATKMAAVAAGRRPFVVANGTEGEPASAKDKTLLIEAPHLVLDGAVLAAEAVGAREAVVCVERTSARAVAAVQAAMAERTAAGLDTVGLRLATAPSRYVAGEESALVNWLNGNDAKPTFTPPRPFERGVDGRPTLVQNVETLAHVALIARFGPGWFRAAGTDSDPGSTLLTISGAVAHPGVYEASLGVPLSAVATAAGSSLGEARAVLLGGYFGTWVTPDAAARVDLTAKSLKHAGAGLGCGVVVLLPAHSCGLAESARVARWLADQTAGQCGPCVHGLAAIADAMVALVQGDAGNRADRQLRRLLDMTAGRGACRHPDGATRFVESSLRVFSDEIVQHRRRGPCRESATSVLPVPRSGGWR